MGVIITITGGPVSSVGQLICAALQNPHVKGLLQKVGGGLGIGPRKLLNPRRMGGCPEAQLEAKSPWPAPRGSLAQYG